MARVGVVGLGNIGGAIATNLVADGHEVLEDGTDPLDPSDDLLLFELNIEFDTDKTDIKSPYFEDLDVVGKVLQRDPGATAVIEGHADQRKTSKRVYNQQLSERRAKAAALAPTIRGIASADRPMVGHFTDSDVVLDFLAATEHPRLAALGTSCPDHFLRTKVKPLVLAVAATYISLLMVEAAVLARHMKDACPPVTK